MSPSPGKKVFSLAYVTGSRADFGIWESIAFGLKKEKRLRLSCIATGSQLHAVQKGTFPVTPDYQVPIPDAGRHIREMGESLSVAYAGFLALFDTFRPDALLVLGDRYESLAAAQAAFFQQIPIVHFHGGETTEGSLDNTFRTCISALADWHFVAAQPFREKLLATGISPASVRVCGAPGLDRFARISPAHIRRCERVLKKEKYLLVSFHPVTRLPDLGLSELDQLLAALKQEPRKLILSRTFGDSAASEFNSRLEDFWNERGQRDGFVNEEDIPDYGECLRHAELLIGNSSSGLIEAPWFRVPVLNVGIRQKGRLSTAHTLHVPAKKKAIQAALLQALQPEWKQQVKRDKNPYGSGYSMKVIVPALLNWLEKKHSLPKS